MDRLANWIEIPTHDIKRATSFYEKVLEVALIPLDLGDVHYAIFPTKSLHNAGALVQGTGYAPSQEGPVLYLDATDRIDALVDRAVAAGATLVMPPTLLSQEAGHVAYFIDTEGNRIGLQSAVAEARDLPVSDDMMPRLLQAANKTFAFLLRKTEGFDDPARKHLQWEHGRNMFALLRAGKLQSVTALMDGTDVLGFGILAVGSREEAEAILREDPNVRGGRLTFEVLSGMSFNSDELRF